MCPEPESFAGGQIADVGVLFVHGIGEQRPGETLLQFGEPLRRYIEQLLQWKGAPENRDVRVRFASLLQEGAAQENRDEQ
jgi:hypothetical protein